MTKTKIDLRIEAITEQGFYTENGLSKHIGDLAKDGWVLLQAVVYNGKLLAFFTRDAA
jgi:hypothetical protein